MSTDISTRKDGIGRGSGYGRGGSFWLTDLRIESFGDSVKVFRLSANGYTGKDGRLGRLSLEVPFEFVPQLIQAMQAEVDIADGIHHDPPGWDGNPICNQCGYETDEVGHCIVCGQA